MISSSAPTPGLSVRQERTSADSDAGSRDLHAAFEQLQPGLLGAARRWAPAEAVDDVVQETWMAVVVSIDKFEGRSQFSTWVFGILWRQCCKQWRRVGSGPVFDNNPPDIESTVPEVDPSRVFEGRVSAERIFGAIEGLPDKYREIILLRDVFEMPAAEACERLNLSEANQRVRLYRARRHLRSALPDLIAA